MRSTNDDRTTRARIRDAAITRFATDGLDASLRSIAADAGVSAGLIMHHFGSRSGLRDECDAYVFDAITRAKVDVLAKHGAPDAFLVQMAQLDGYAALTGYVLRSLQVGGERTRQFVDGLVAETVEYLEIGVREGTVRPSRNPEARARVITESALGSLLLQMPTINGSLDVDDLPRWLREHIDSLILPHLELYTEGLLTDSTLLDTYLAASEGNTP